MTDSLRIDGQKLDLNPRRLVQWLDGMDNWETAKDIFPIYVEVSPFGRCNHECTFCSVDYVLDRPDMNVLSYGVFVRMLEDMAKHGVKAVMFAGAGEPLLYCDKSAGKDLADIILAADDFGLDTAITTNGVGLDEDFCGRAFEAQGLKWIRVSINAGDRDTYAAIHRTKAKDFDTVVANLRRANDIRKQVSSPVKLLANIVALPAARGVQNRRRLGIYHDYPSNIGTIVPLALKMREAGVDNLAVKPFKQHLVALEDTRSTMYRDVTYDEMEEVFDSAEALQTKDFEVTVRRAAMQQQASEDRGYKRCYSTPYFWAYVEADGNVWGCSAYLGRLENGVEKDGDHRFRFGNVNEQSFSEIWRGERRKSCWLFTRKLPEYGGLDVNNCMKGCQMDMPNVYLWSLMNPPEDVNFVK